jgi:hypothetical protein
MQEGKKWLKLLKNIRCSGGTIESMEESCCSFKMGVFGRCGGIPLDEQGAIAAMILPTERKSGFLAHLITED